VPSTNVYHPNHQQLMLMLCIQVAAACLLLALLALQQQAVAGLTEADDAAVLQQLVTDNPSNSNLSSWVGSAPCTAGEWRRHDTPVVHVALPSVHPALLLCYDHAGVLTSRGVLSMCWHSAGTEQCISVTHLTVSCACVGWQHVECAAGRVVQIVLPGAGLQGTLPPLAGELRLQQQQQQQKN
jgi:hypothetical protein